MFIALNSQLTKTENMFSLFMKKSLVDILESKYERLIKVSLELFTISRAMANEKYAKADKILKEIVTINIVK